MELLFISKGPVQLVASHMEASTYWHTGENSRIERENINFL
jgi:hypothetical protein